MHEMMRGDTGPRDKVQISGLWLSCKLKTTVQHVSYWKAALPKLSDCDLDPDEEVTAANLS